MINKDYTISNTYPMTFDTWKKRLTIDADIMGGNPCFPGSRLTINNVASLVKKEATYSEIFSDYPFLTTEDIRYAVMFNSGVKT